MEIAQKVNIGDSILNQAVGYKISFYKEESVLSIAWDEHPASTLLRNGFYQFIQQATNVKSQNWLFDNRQIYYIELADQNWIASLTPFLSRLQINKIAIVLTQEAHDLFFTENIISVADRKFNILNHTAIEVFSNVDTALDWLNSGGLY